MAWWDLVSHPEANSFILEEDDGSKILYFKPEDCASGVSSKVLTSCAANEICGSNTYPAACCDIQCNPDGGEKAYESACECVCNLGYFGRLCEENL